jgi:hypothetical protein
MEKGNSNRTRIIGLRLTPSEYAKIERKWKASTCRKLSDYIRRSLFDKPIVTTYRDASLDEFMLQMIQLRKELNAIGNNFNQAVKKLHILQQIPEFKSWLIRYDVESKILFNKIDEVKKSIQKFAELWLQ